MGLQSDSEDKDKKAKCRTDAAIGLGASALGGAAGSLLGSGLGIWGAMAGSVAGEAITRVKDDFVGRVLSRRERERVDTVTEWAQLKVRQHLEADEKPRDDGFFAKRDESGRVDADELVEGVLLQAKNEHEEKKLRFLGSLIANIGFRAGVAPVLDDYVSPVQGNSLLRIAGNLSYRQFCVLALAGRGEALPVADFLSLPHRHNAEFEALRQEMRSMQSELFDPRLDIEGGEHRFELTSLGRIAYELLDLRDAPREDLQKVHDLLSDYEAVN